MPDRFAPALLLEVFAFWFVLRWLLPTAILLLLGRVLIGVMAIGTLATLDQHHHVWAAFFAGSAVLASMLLRRWRYGRPGRESKRTHLPGSLAWRRVEPAELAALCEQRVGQQVDAAVPATIAANACVLALAGDGLWVLEDESHFGRPRLGRVLACWARRGLVAHVEHLRRRDRLEFSWPRQGALVKALTPSGVAADLFTGHLVADEFSRRA